MTSVSDSLFHSIRWTSEKIRQRLHLIEPLIYRRRWPLPPFHYLKLEGPSVEPPVAPEVDDEHWPTIPWETPWGGPNIDFVLRSRFQVPRDWEDESAVALYLPIGESGDFSHPEALVYVDGHPLSACDRHHQEILLSPRWCEGAAHTLALHGWTGGTHNLRFDRVDEIQPAPSVYLVMHPCQVVQIDGPTRELVALARVALGVADHLEVTAPARAHLYNALDDAFKLLDTREPFDGRFYASVPAAHEILREGIARSGVPLDVDITAAGHAHIDVAWLWTLGQTRRKAGRTFHTIIRLMEQFPEFRCTQSQAQLYDYVRQDYAPLFESIRERVQEGRWEPIGGMWVEADCNLSGGESLARQFLLGQEFFRQHFGPRAETQVLWLPDVFGYAWNLPQLIREAGLKYFFTIKIGWSQYNRLPYDSFWWQGLDGTRVLTHFSPTKAATSAFASTYNADASPGQILSTWTNFQQKDWGRPGKTPPLLMSYGYGDGGGGPTREMIENIREMGSFPAAPRVQCGTVAEFFEKLESTVGDRLPTWNGELYLEYHRGTYTTQARNKRANRKSEFLLHDAEFMACLASLLDPDYVYPHRVLRRAWELVCLNQFHDIIPGSSIGEVYAESLEQYAEVDGLAGQVRDGAMAAVASRVGGDLLVVNATSFPRRDLVFWPIEEEGLGSLEHANGSRVHVQAVRCGALLDVGELPPYSVTSLYLAPPGIPSSESRVPGHESPISSLSVTANLLENDLLRVEFDDAGDINRIYDKANGREVLARGAIANQFQAFEDRPKTPDAWEIDINYDDVLWLAEPADSVRVVESGPLRAVLEVRRRVLNSEIVQGISLAHNSPRLDFETVIQWRERHVLLKVAFPVDVLSPVATHEIQWGNVQRPTHRNTSWDWARFETCAQKWVDLSEGGYGVSLLNDCKYGHDIHDNVLRMTLLRGPTDPDPGADLGEHHFTYSLLPHAGEWDEFTVAQAYALNDPLIVWTGGRQATKDEGPRVGDERREIENDAFAVRHSSLVNVDCPNVVIETIKEAEDGRGLIIRLYESQRRRGEFVLTAGFPLASVWRTNLVEENQERLEVEGRHLRFTIRPYQILTLRLLPEQRGQERA